jgi:hypothetical protein
MVIFLDWESKNININCEEVISNFDSTFLLIHRGKRLLKRPMLAATKNEARALGATKITDGGGFLGPSLGFLSGFSMELM